MPCRVKKSDILGTQLAPTLIHTKPVRPTPAGGWSFKPGQAFLARRGFLSDVGQPGDFLAFFYGMPVFACDLRLVGAGRKK